MINPFTALARRLGGDRIAWRIAITVLLGIIGTQIATILLIYLVLPGEAPRHAMSSIVAEISAASRDPQAAIAKGEDGGEFTWERGRGPREPGPREPGPREMGPRDRDKGPKDMAPRDMGPRDLERGGPPRPPWPFSELERELREAISEADYPELQVRPWRPRRPQAGLDIGPGLSIVIPLQSAPPPPPSSPGEAAQLRAEELASGELRLPPVFAVGLRDANGQWYTVRPRQVEPLVPRWLFTTLWLLTTAAIIAGLTLWTTARLLRPLRGMADAARDWQAEAPPQMLPETGPMEFRAIAQALNGMQGRIHRFVADRAALVAALSHDLRTPLTSITGAVTSLRELGEKLPPEDRKDLLLSIEEEAGRLSRFIANMLDMSRIESGAVAPRSDLVDVAEVIRNVLERAKRTFPGKDTSISIAPDLPPIRGDANLLGQVLFNLIDNAHKYGGPAGAIIHARREGGDVLITVTDEGPGVKAADLERIFEKFYRSGRVDGRKAGTGLGLSICRGLVKAMGGAITAQSPAVRRRGTRIIMRFPVASRPKQETAA